MAKKLDLLNKVFGELTVVEAGKGKLIGKKNPKHRPTWICKCSCGVIVEVLASNLNRKNTNSTSCGCKFKNSIKYNSVDLINQEFGLLKVISKSTSKTKTRGAIWVCSCRCGNIVEIPTNGLTSGNYTTCGDKNRHTKSIYIGEIPISHINAIKQNAIKRNLEFSVTPDYLLEIFLKQNRICMLSGIELSFTNKSNPSSTRNFTTASLDRIDSSKGYIEGNVQWVHKDVNKMKNNHSTDDFIEWCRKCFLNSYHINERPTFDEYFMMLAFDISTRSEDRHVKHGAVIVNKSSNHIIGTGYNATIKGSDKDKIDLNNREERRPWMIHAEENAILHCSKSPLDLPLGAKIYVTGTPCVNCLQRIINFGINEIYVAKRKGSITENNHTIKMTKEILDMSNTKVIEMDLNNKWIKKVHY